MPLLLFFFGAKETRSFMKKLTMERKIKMKEKFMKKIEAMWDAVKEKLENSLPYVIITGLIATGGLIGFFIGHFHKK